jgi:methylated-DNA-[protein]-cysteine S-methyltransferase
MATPNINWKKYSPFQQRVYKAIMKIPAGKVMTYGQVAKMIGSPGAARAVGTALSKNQDVPIIPCHRVIASNGKMGGYSGRGGVSGKIKLLKKEGYL